ncbi:MAG: type II secretion system protein [Proteobacteria bacterium]|nr:type II secretion system protein [Pseudomonadota bacterium]
MRRKQTPSEGFTLLELSVVMFIMLILLGFSLPRFSTLFESDLQKETQKIAGIVKDLRLQAILKGENYKLVFDTKKSEYAVLTKDPDYSQTFSPHEKYSEPIRLADTVEFHAVARDVGKEQTFRFSGREIEFDKIFGRKFEFGIDSSGFVDLFTVKLKDRNNYLSLSVVNIMGKTVIGEETPL